MKLREKEGWARHDREKKNRLASLKLAAVAWESAVSRLYFGTAVFSSDR